MSDLYWLERSLQAMPLAVWMYGILGAAWALVIVPRREWHEWATVATVAILAGGAIVSATLMVLGVLGASLETPLLTQAYTLGAVAAMTLVGLGLAWWKHRRTLSARVTSGEALRWGWDERLLLGLVVVALVVRWVVTAYWTFTAYDALWVYGSQPRLYFLTGIIPHSIDYYPQFLQLQFTFMQLGVGLIDDHVARVVVMALHLGSVLAVFSLGRRLFNRRVGVYAMALWALYPHVSEWAYVGDLEIPLAYGFTVSALFFLQAWQASSAGDRRRWALMAGLAFGVAMWTKPTAGAFVWGVVLVVALDFLRVRLDWRRHRARFEVAFITGLACIPLGSVWYLRNIALGHDAVRFPHPSWLERATRSADMFGWLLLALALLMAYLWLRGMRGRRWGVIGAGIGLLALGVMPSLPWLNPERINPPESYIQGQEWALIIAGCVLIGGAMWRIVRDMGGLGRDSRLLLWGYALALPYFVTWFYSYSYHARLSFAIVPLLILPCAYLVVRLTAGIYWTGTRRLGYGLGVMGLSVMGVFGTYFAPAPEFDWLWTERYPDDHARYMVQTPELVLLWDYLTGYERETGHEARIMASGEQRLPFFFPLNTITMDVVPTALDELAGYTHFIYGALARWRYEDEGIVPHETQIVGALGRRDLFEPYFIFADGIFRYELYALHLDERFDLSAFELGNVEMDEVVFGEWARYRGHSISSQEFSYGTTVYVSWVWEVLRPAEADYTLEVSVINSDGEQVYRWEEKPIPHEHGYYDTRLWQAGEFIRWDTHLRYPSDAPALPCAVYEFRLSFYRLDEAGERHDAPISRNGETVASYAMREPFTWGGGCR